MAELLHISGFVVHLHCSPVKCLSFRVFLFILGGGSRICEKSDARQGIKVQPM